MICFRVQIKLLNANRSLTILVSWGRDPRPLVLLWLHWILRILRVLYTHWTRWYSWNMYDIFLPWQDFIPCSTTMSRGRDVYQSVISGWVQKCSLWKKKEWSSILSYLFLRRRVALKEGHYFTQTHKKFRRLSKS